MRDRDLVKTILVLILLILGVYVVLLDILMKVSPKGFVYLFYPLVYVFNLYQSASPGEKLSAIFLLIGGAGGWFINQWTVKKE